MVLDTQKRKQVTYFTGIEIENTCMKGQLTLFVVGVRPVEEIELLANNNKAKHIYFGTSQSFTPETDEEMSQWTDYEIGKSGRITHPMYLKAGESHYTEISWEDAFQKIGKSP